MPYAHLTTTKSDIVKTIDSTSITLGTYPIDYLRIALY